MTDLIVFAPHMDDESLGCGGLLALAEDPLVVFGIDGSDERPEVHLVAKELGFRFECLYTTASEGRLLSIDRPELVSKMEAILHRERPARVMLPSPSYHQDHTAMYEAGLAATRPLSRHGYLADLVATYEYPGSAWRHDGREDQLTWYVDIEDVLDQKLAAIDHYTNSQRGRAMVDPEVVRGWAALRGNFVGVHYAEAFTLLRSVERSGRSRPAA